LADFIGNHIIKIGSDFNVSPWAEGIRMENLPSGGPVTAAANRGKVFLLGKLGMALFERAWAIRGMEQLMMDLVERPRFVEELLDRILYEWNLPIIDQQIALRVDGFYFADDWGAQAGLLFHPRMWRTFIKPRMAVCYQRVKEKGLWVGQHSDGDVVAILPDLIEIGLDIFNPVDPTIYDPNVASLSRNFKW
jgi:uroporphyrinogen decarboxylase